MKGSFNTKINMRTTLFFPFFFRRYPKPGTQNPIASLKIADLADPKNFRIRDIKPPAFLINEWVQFQPPFFVVFSP